MTSGDLAEPIIFHRSHICDVAFTLSLAGEAYATQLTLQWATTDHPDHSFTIFTDKAFLRTREAPDLQNTHQLTTS